MNKEIVLGGGCFWCLEATFAMVRGILSVTSGYSGGRINNPTYEMVCGGLSGHAEVVRLKYDDRIITSKDVLRLFFALHDPTTPDRQGNDIGPQYRSVIFYSDEEQKQISLEAMEEVQSELSMPLSTELIPLERFYAAEDHHQNYYRRNTNQAYCRAVIAPKLKKLLHEHRKLL